MLEVHNHRSDNTNTSTHNIQAHQNWIKRTYTGTIACSYTSKHSCAHPLYRFMFPSFFSWLTSRLSNTKFLPRQKPPSGNSCKYFSTPPCNWKQPLISFPISLCSSADARSQRTPPVQYMSTSFPLSWERTCARMCDETTRRDVSVMWRVIQPQRFSKLEKRK